MHEVEPGAGVGAGEGAGVGIGVYELSDILDEPPPPQALKKIVAKQTLRPIFVL